MAIMVRADDVSIGDGQGNDPTVTVRASVYDDVTTRVIGTQVFTFSLAGMAAMTAAQKRAVVVDAVDTWAAAVKANAGAAVPILTLVGQSKVVP
ncbi:MAG: hypothetical protein M3440_00770 [Chloroflexota bacterium]|nr:hypothetical protein [Chloroflexota bacterium]